MWFDSVEMLDALRERGIESVYIEGGPTTTAGFLLEGSIDVVQLHLSPTLLGMGQGSFPLPGLDRVADGIRFRRHRFQLVGEGAMFVGEAPRPGDGERGRHERS